MWQIVEQTDSFVMLEDPNDNQFRIAVIITDHEDDTTAQRVYPCRECGYEEACPGGCHS